MPVVNIEEDLEEDQAIMPVRKRQVRTIQDTEEKEGSGVKKQKLTLAEGIYKIVEEMKETRIHKIEVATRPTRAIQLLTSEYNNLEASSMAKAISYLVVPMHAEIFLALKDQKEQQESWLFQGIGL